MERTSGATNVSNDHVLMYWYADYNQHGGVIGNLYGQNVEFSVTDGDVGSAASNKEAATLRQWLDIGSSGGKVYGDAYGIKSTNILRGDGGVTGDFHGMYNDTAMANDANVGGSVYGFKQYVDLGFTTIIDGNAYGMYLDIDQDTAIAGTTYQIYSNEGSNIDYFLYQNGTAPSHFGGRIDGDGGAKLGDVDANYVDVNGTDGQLTLVGDAKVWRDMVVRPQRLKLPGSNPPAEDNIDNFPFLRFDRDTEESVFFTWVVPNDFATGTANVRGHYTFVVENPPSGAGNESVRMGFEYKKVSEGDVYDFSSGTSSGYVDEVLVDGETAYILHETPTGVCDTTGWVAHDEILFRFFRKAADAADTFDSELVAADNDVWLKTCHLEYLTDKLGASE